MAQGVDLFKYLDFQGLTEGAGIDFRSYSSLALAYLGDAVYSVLIRTMVLQEGNTSVEKMHKKTSALVEAHAQSEIIRAIMEHLTEEEMSVYRRGRNAHSGSLPKNQSMSDYRRATGFEALMGYLYLEHKMERAYELLEIGLPWVLNVKN